MVNHPVNTIQTGGRVDQEIEDKTHLSLETFDVVVTFLEHLLAALTLCEYNQVLSKQVGL